MPLTDKEQQTDIARPKPGTKRSGLVLLVLVGAFCLIGWSWAHYWQLTHQVPTNADWSQAADHVKGHWVEADAIAIVPFWELRGEAAFKGMKRMLVQHPERETFPNAKRLWVAEAFGRFRSESMSATGRYQAVGDPVEFGNVKVHLFEITEGKSVRLDFMDILDRAEVFELRGRTRHPCPLRGRRHACSGADWNYVGLTRKLVGLSIREMIWAHPNRDGILIRFKDIELGEKLIIAGALTFWAAGFADGTPVLLDVAVDGEFLDRLKVENQPGLQRKEIELSAFVEGPHEVTFTVFSENAGRRHFTFQAMME